MSKTRCNNPLPSTELLIYRHSTAKYLCMTSYQGPEHFRASQGRKSAIEAMVRKYAK